jgi:hypothetical protein
MKRTINLYEFRDAFHRMDRRNFSYHGLEVLYDALMEWEDAGGQEIELDVVALCCDYAEDCLDDIAHNHGFTVSEDLNDEERTDAIMQWLYEQTTVCGTTSDGTVVYQQF